MLWYTDNLDKVAQDGKIIPTYFSGTNQYFADQIKAKDILPYLGSGLKVSGNDAVDGSGGKYYTDHASNGKLWLIGYEMPTEDARVIEKLEARAATTGLLWKNAGNTFQYKKDNGKDPKKVYIAVIDFSE